MVCQGDACFRLTIRLVRWLPVCFVLLLQAWTYYVYVYYFCFGFVSNFVQRVVYLTVFNIIYALAIWAYVQTIFTDVSNPPENFAVSTEVHDNYCAAVNDPAQQRAMLEEFAQHNQIQVLTRINNEIRYCVSCTSIKPDRSHHCSRCNRCILRMDHHCPWLNTCVGYGNYKGFLLVLFYGLLVCSFIFATCLPVYVGFFAGWLDDEDFDDGRVALASVLTLFFVAGMFVMPMLGMVHDHLGLLTRNRTTIECLQKMRFADGASSNAYDLGRMENVRQVFGETVLLWPLPIPTQLGDGVVYPRREGNGKSARS